MEFVLAIVILLLDQGTKIWAERALSRQPLVLIPGALELTYLENRGAVWAEKASHSPLLLKIFGPAIRIYDSDFIDQLPDFPSYIELGALTTRHPMGRFVSKFAPKLYRTFFPNPKDSHSATTKDVISIKTLHLNSCSAIKVITHCINFIKNGKFVSSQKIKKL